MAARRYVESGDGWRVTAWFRDNRPGKYRVEMTSAYRATVSPDGVDDLVAALRRSQVAMADRRHPDAAALDQAGDVGRAIRLIRAAAA